MKSYKNIKILRDKPQVSDNEINSYMDFDSLLGDYKEDKKRINQNNKRKLVIFFLAFSLIIAGYYASNYVLMDEIEIASNENSPDNEVKFLDSVSNQKTEEKVDSINRSNLSDVNAEQVDSILVKTRGSPVFCCFHWARAFASTLAN